MKERAFSDGLRPCCGVSAGDVRVNHKGLGNSFQRSTAHSPL